jgi:hypothetical protein
MGERAQSDENQVRDNGRFLKIVDRQKSDRIR